MKYNAQDFRKKHGGKFRQIPPEKIISWLERHFEVKPRKGGQEQRICNPFDHDTKFKFSVNPDKGLCHCWTGDEWAGPVNPKTGKRNCSFVRFVRLYLKCSYPEAIKEILQGDDDLQSYLTPQGRAGNTEAPRIIEVELPSGIQSLTISTSRAADPLRSWLKSRGYTEERIARGDLQHAAFDVVWPYYEFDALVYWQSRSRLNKRFEFPPVNHYDSEGNVVGVSPVTKTEFFYGFDEVEPASYLIITEAIFDQNTLGAQCLASGGAALVEKQVKKLRILGPRKGVILSPDNDKAGLKSVILNNPLLTREGFKVYYSIPPSLEYEEDGEIKLTKDWNELFTKLKFSLKEIREIHDRRIKPLTNQRLIELRKKINGMGKNR